MKPLGKAVRAGLLAPLCILAQSADLRITAIRFWSLGDVTRVAIQTTGEVEYHSERITGPDRLFFDLKGVRHARRGMETIPVNDPLLRQIRVAQSQPEVTRVVLDLAAPAEFSVSQLTNPDRVMIELRVPRPGPPAPPERSVTGAVTAPEPAPEPAVAPVSAAPAKPEAAKPEAAKPEAAKPEAVKPEARPAPPPAKAEAKPEPAPPAPAPEVATAARRDSRGNQSLTRVLGLKLQRVVLDPGHGGHDTGTIGPGGLAEKTLVLDVAKRLGALITERLGSEVIFTRSDDTFLPLEARTALANEKKADLFLSIHANSSRVKQIAGSETYYLNFTTSPAALEVAARENATSQQSIHELQTLVQKIALKEKVEESREFAGTVQKALYTGLARSRGRNRGVKKAPFVVLIGAQMPSVLAEIAFLSNPREENLLKRPEYRQKVAEALFKGLSQYANTLSHFQVAQRAAL